MLFYSENVAIVVYCEHVTRSHIFSFAYVLAVIPLAYLVVYTSYKLLSQMTVLCHWPSVDVEREAYPDSQEDEPLLTTANDLGGRCSRDI